jgi:hypothetical protein
MPVVKASWNDEMRLKLCVVVGTQMNFVPMEWKQICEQLGPAYSEYHCKYDPRNIAYDFPETKLHQERMEIDDAGRTQKASSLRRSSNARQAYQQPATG